MPDNLSQPHQKKLDDLKKKYSVSRTRDLSDSAMMQSYQSIDSRPAKPEKPQDKRPVAQAERLAFKRLNSSALSGSQTQRVSQPKPMRFQALDNQVNLNSALINEQVAGAASERPQGKHVKSVSQFSSKVIDNLSKLQ